MLKVALTGGLASGKTFVGRILEGMGCFLVQADLLGHEALLPDGCAYARVIENFGSGILDTGGLIDRKALAAEVFSKPERLALLNSLVHPSVRARIEELLNEFAKREPRGIAVVEAAIHVETGSYRQFEKLIVTWCRQEQQMERAMHRDGATREEVMARLARQMPLDEKKLLADYVIDTSGTKEDTVRQTERVLQELRKIVV
jgi:dephospho-CoA kinase